ncbi:acyl-CoA thioesterase [Palleronia pelagia]|uniref:Acyl-CoA thioesterase FadM n=1 Tax=Palleronia pelagia TaxID=387096 RepID=A0A1H8FF53_9RHOB|nr:acyl-CoA thioesterase [Palleronia pelagia]SEN29807.1 Acyl-CoA thioesterase FadM [Palleronia pelagia]
MYPVIRMAKEAAKFRNAPRLGLFDTHESRHVCWPHDIDLWMELNNGRTLTLYDLGRMILFMRTGVVDVMKREKWAGTIAGASVRYRARVRMFDRIDMRTRVVGWDDRFFYIEQGMWRGETCTSHALLRTAVTSKAGLVPMADVAKVMDGMQSPPLPDWIAEWARAEAMRPWPPMQDQPAPKLAAQG